jgi:hypothetical protein
MMPMSLCLPRFVPAYPLLALCLPLWGQTALQEPVISEREFRFREVEQRALDLSKRLSEISGTEPVQLIDRDKSLSPVRYESSAQRAFDVLPGPLEEIEPAVEEPEEESEPVVFASQVSRVTPTTQQRKGDYYIMPTLGLVFTGETKYSEEGTNHALEGKLGNLLGVSMGKRWDNWIVEIKASYQHLEYEDYLKSSTLYPTKYEADEELYALSLSGGYSIPVSERLSTNGAVGLGFGWRRNIITKFTDIGTGWKKPTSGADLYSSLVFTYGLSLGFEYLFVNNFSGYCGYRLMGLSSNKSFEGAFQHLLELGVGANF